MAGTPAANGELPAHHHGQQRREPQRHPELHPDRRRGPGHHLDEQHHFHGGVAGHLHRDHRPATRRPPSPKSGSLPTGVTFTDNGDGTATLAGTPSAGTRGSYAITLKASNGVSPNATQSFTLTVDAAPAITSADATTFTVGILGQLHRELDTATRRRA